jgi:hypothetical protein
MSNYDPIDMRGRELEKRDAEARDRNARKVEIADIKWLMSSPRGRRIVWRLLKMARTFQISFNTNAMQMAFNEGNRNLGNQLLDEVMELCPDVFPVMQKEQQSIKELGNKEQQDGKRDGNGDSQSNI